MEQRLREQIVRLFGFSVCIVTGFIATHEVLLGTTDLGWSLMFFALSLWAMIQFLLSPRTMDYIAVAFLISTFVCLAGIVIGSGGRALGANVAIPTFLVLSTMLVKTRIASLLVGMGYIFLLGLAAVLAATDYPYPIAIKPENAATAVYRLPILMSMLAAMVIFPFKSAIIRLNDRYAAAVAREQRAHELRKAHEERLADVALLAGGWFWSADNNMQIDHLSPSFSHLTGIDRGAAINKSPEELANILTRSREVNFDTSTLKDARVYSNTDFAFQGTDGKRSVVESAGQPLLDNAGELSGYIGVARDVSDLRAVQAKLRALREVDPETGLASKRAMTQALEQAAVSARTKLRRHVVCCLMLGNVPGEVDPGSSERVAAVAQLLKESVRTQDFVGRIDTNEYCLLLRDYGADSVRNIPERIVAAIRQMEFSDSDQGHSPGAFAGVAVLEGRNADAKTAFNAARLACSQSLKTDRLDVVEVQVNQIAVTS